jgi:hypothetical protein
MDMVPMFSVRVTYLELYYSLGENQQEGRSQGNDRSEKWAVKKGDKERDRGDKKVGNRVRNRGHTEQDNET